MMTKYKKEIITGIKFIIMVFSILIGIILISILAPLLQEYFNVNGRNIRNTIYKKRKNMKTTYICTATCNCVETKSISYDLELTIISFGKYNLDIYIYRIFNKQCGCKVKNLKCIEDLTRIECYGTCNDFDWEKKDICQSFELQQTFIPYIYEYNFIENEDIPKHYNSEFTEDLLNFCTKHDCDSTYNNRCHYI